MFCMHVCLFAMCIQGVGGGEKALNAPELVIRVDVNHPVDAGNRIWVLYKSKCSWL